MAKFVKITREAMEAFLAKQGFRFGLHKGHPVNPLAKRSLGEESVYSKLLTPNLAIRVFSSVVDGETRDKGTDAIRVQLFYRAPDGTIFPVGDRNAKRVHRVEGWAKNLANRLNNWTLTDMGPNCGCGAPTIRRKGKRKDSTSYEFWGCVTFQKTECRMTPRMLPSEKSATSQAKTSKGIVKGAAA